MRTFLLLFLLCCVQQGWAQLQTDFSSNDQEVCLPSLIQLSDHSTSNVAVVQWEWLNNGVVFSTVQNPALYLNTAGSYTICLRTLDANGNRDTLCRSNYLTAFNGPTAAFNILQTSGCSPLSVAFTNRTQLGDAPIQQWRWDFGDGTLDTLQMAPTHLYTTVGNFDVTLVAIDTNGCRDAQLQSNVVTVYPNVTASIALSSYQVQCSLPATVGFTGIGNAQGLTYNWDFDDNNTATGRNVTHAYTSPGCFLPTLIVSNAWCADTATVTSCITVADAPTASFTMDDSIHCSIPFSVQFTNQSTNATSYSWDFGDSTYANSTNASHHYSSISAADTTTYLHGLIPVILTASNAVGCTARDTQYIRGSLLETGIVRANLPCAPDTAFYTANSQNVSSYVTPVSYQWSLDNVAFMAGATATAFYPDSGVYNVSVIVTDQLGCQDTSSLVVPVGIDPVIDSVVSDTNYVCRLTNVDFLAYGSSYIDFWYWTFDDNSTGIGAGINHNFRDTGAISGLLLASFRGCIDTFSLDTYYIFPPIAAFSIEDTCNNLQVYFKDESVGAHRWFWDFGDPTTTADTSSLPNPTYTYPAIDSYYVKLTVYNDSTNCVDTFISVVQLSAPIADFEIPDSVCTVADVVPINNSSNASSYYWEANGTEPFSRNLAEPILTYATAGIYDIKLWAVGSNSCLDTLQKTIYVAGLDTHLLRAPDPACRPAVVTFTDSSLGLLSPIVDWQWANGSTGPTATQVYVFPGWQVMTLQVTNDWGCTFDLVDSFPVGGLFLNYTTNRDVCLGRPTTFTAITSSPANSNVFDPFVYYWDFGDGTRDTTTALTVTHLYDSAGIYTVCLEVLDTVGCLTTLCRTDWVTVHDPTALFTADTFFSSCPPLEVDFSNLSASGATWSWSFGDGSVSSLENPTHVYSTAGFYNVALSVEAFPGCAATDTISQMIQITGPTGNFSSPPGSHCAPYSLELTANGSNIAGYTWLFGNGDFQVHAGGSNDTAYYTYTTPGRFVPTVVLNDGLGCQISIEGDTIDVLPSPVAQFHAEPLTCGVDSVHYLLDTFSTTWDAVFWSFPQGQPSSSTQLEPWIYYATTVNAQAQLIVVDGLCADTLIRTDFVRLQPPPTAAFDMVYTDSCAPALFQFVDRSTITSQDSIQQWQWDFGNGQSATQADTSLFYNSANSFQIQLIVSDSNNCSDTVVQTITLYEVPNLALSAPTNSCEGDTVQLQATTSGSVQWQSNSWLSDSSSLRPLTLLNGLQQYTATATNTFGCQNSDTLLLQAAPYLLTNLADSSQLCLGDSLTLQANSNGLAVQWRSTAALPCFNCPNPTVAPTQNTWYYAQVDSATACVAWDSILIKVAPLPTAAVIGDTSICEGDSLLLQATGGNSYRWSPSAAVSNSSTAQIWVRPLAATTYGLWVQDSLGCVDSTQHQVDLRSRSTTPLVGDTICRGDSATLQLSSGSAPIWQGPALSCQTCDTPIAAPNDSAWYLVAYTNADNCPVVDSVSIAVLDTRFFQASAVDSICMGDSVQLLVQGAPASVRWSPSTGLSAPNSDAPWATPTTNRWYQVRLQQGNCSVSDSVKINFLPTTNISALDVTYCIGDSAQLLATGNANRYQWQPRNNLSSPDSFATMVYALSTQQYQVIGRGRCNTDTAFATVSVQALPSLQVDSLLTAALGQTITLEANSNALDLLWSPSADLSCSNCWQTEWTVDSGRTFYITAVDDLGCLVVDSIRIIVQSACVADLVYVPNAFTPDGDGQNDVLYAQTGSVQTLLGFQIYNRWGELVFETRDFAQGWDGRYKGQALTPDFYGYVLQFECPQSGEILLKKGNITILR
jgi:gliding motility-associated-like protein